MRDRLIRLRAGRALRWPVALAIGASACAPGLAHTDDSGCQVILCLFERVDREDGGNGGGGG
ncbi:hypothetical protein [Caballeronia mineralivorans]|uniref:hypothetical protein n=1 Tax=Caballeronia mineralivorans TaxID=2010198 RepID=UPI00064C0047|nr:hypothetical protein [Caballeronia mineralivorans]